MIHNYNALKQQSRSLSLSWTNNYLFDTAKLRPTDLIRYSLQEQEVSCIMPLDYSNQQLRIKGRSQYTDPISIKKGQTRQTPCLLSSIKIQKFSHMSVYKNPMITGNGISKINICRIFCGDGSSKSENIMICDH